MIAFLHNTCCSRLHMHVFGLPNYLLFSARTISGWEPRKQTQGTKSTPSNKNASVDVLAQYFTTEITRQTRKATDGSVACAHSPHETNTRGRQGRSEAMPHTRANPLSQVSEMMEQKGAIQDALKGAADDSEKAALLGEMRSLTTKLYTASGKAKVGCTHPLSCLATHIHTYIHTKYIHSNVVRRIGRRFRV